MSKLEIKDGLEYVPLPFLATGPPDRPRTMGLQVTATLPHGAIIILEGPSAFLDLFSERSLKAKRNLETKLLDWPLNPHGPSELGQALFETQARVPLRLLLHIPA